MNHLWAYFWPVLTAGLLIGGIGGLFAFRKRPRRAAILAGGLALSLAWAAAWHGPLGAADRFTTTIERQAREALNYYEVPQIKAKLHRGPLTRRLILSGDHLDDWQRGELARLFSQLPGVSGATWSGKDAGLPLVAEAGLVAIAGFLAGLLLAYLIELRRRYNAQWTW
jgi:hypothetical protein